MEKKSTRTCYTCGKKIPDVEGKYFCSRDCWEKYQKGFNPIKNRLAIKEIQEKLFRMGKEAAQKEAEQSKDNKILHGEELVKTATDIFGA